MHQTDLMQEDCSTQPPPTGRLIVRGQGTVVRGDRHLTGYSLSFSPLHGKAKVNSISRVIFYNDKDTS